MTGEAISVEEFGQALADGVDTNPQSTEEDSGTYRKSMQPPATIHTDHFEPFVVSKLWGWAYTGYGVFASGQFVETDRNEPESFERDVLFPFEEVTLIELDFAAVLEQLGDDNENGDQGETDGATRNSD